MLYGFYNINSENSLYKHQTCEWRQVTSNGYLHAARQTEEEIDTKIKTPLSVIQPSVFSDHFLLVLFQILHKNSNTLLLCVDLFNINKN